MATHRHAFASALALLLALVCLPAAAPAAPRVISPTKSADTWPSPARQPPKKPPLPPKSTTAEPQVERVARPIPEPGIRNGVGKKVYHFRIDTDTAVSDIIDRSWHFRMHRALVAAENANADAFILEIDTYGGALDAAFMMQTRLLDTKIPVYAFVNSKAISAGAIIAMAADHIVMRPTAKIGDALPVTRDSSEPSGMKAADKKVISVVSAEMRAAAKANGHPVDVAVAMVDPDQPLRGFSKKGELLTLTTDEAIRARLTDWVADDLGELLRLADLEGADVVEPRLTALESIAGFLSRQVIVSMLFTLGIVCGLVELKTPGLGLPGALAVLSFGLVFFGTNLADLSVSWSRSY